MDSAQPGEGEPSVGGFCVERGLGRGVMGPTYLGCSPGGRRVAIKVFVADRTADPGFGGRLAEEVEAVRRAGGLHAVPIVAAEPHAVPPWVATAYLEGLSLRDLIRGSGPLPAERCLALAVELAEGLATLHRAGLVHGDVNPGKVILAGDGARLAGCGFVRAVGLGSLLARDPDPLRFAFLSPEQMSGRPAGPASDVFSLGAVLVHAATGRGPFEAAGIPEVADRVVTAVPDLGALPRRLHAPVAACLAKAPEERPTAAALLDMLADPQSSAPSRRSLIAGAAGVAGVGVAAALGLTLLTGKRNPAAKGAAGGGATPPTTPATPSTPSTPSDPLSDPASPDTAPPIPGGAFSISLGSDDAGCVAYSPDGRLLALGMIGSPTVALCDVAARKVLGTVTAGGSAHGSAVSVAFSPDGSLVAAGLEGGTTLLVDVARVASVATLADTAADPVGITNAVFSPDGSILATGNLHASTTLWQVGGGHAKLATLYDPLASQQGDAHGVNCVAISPDGRTLATSLECGLIRMWDIAGRRVARTITGPAGGVSGLAFSPDGSLLAGGTGANAVDLWHPATGAAAGSVTWPYVSDGTSYDVVYTVAFSPDGKTLAASSVGGGGYLWTVAGGKSAGTFLGGQMAFSPDGKTLAAVQFREVLLTPLTT